MTMRTNRSLLAAGTAAAALALFAAPMPAFAQQRTFDFNIPAQDLGGALRALARASGEQVIFQGSAVRGRRSSPLSGSHSVDEALRIMLQGTGLDGSRSRRGILIVAVATPASVEVQAGSAAADSGSAAEEAIVVTGSRLAQRSQDGPTPVTTFTEDAIAQLGSSNLADVLDYLPQNSFSQVEVNSASGARPIQLRGLGRGTTLVLANGRRTVTSGLQISRSGFDLNQIPLAAVERVEILSNSASAIYGADAIAGVVNVILRRRIERPVVDLYYGLAEGGHDERRASLSFGVSSSSFRSAFTADYFRRTPLFGFERDITSSSDFRRFGGTDRRSQNANPGNVFSNTAANLPGLTSTFAAVPSGSTGVGLTRADFLATQGILNLASPNSFTSIIPASERYSGSASFEFDLSDSITLFGDLLYSHTEDRLRLSPNSLSNLLVPANNPFNPFGVPVRVRFLLTDLGPREGFSESELVRGVLGARGEIGDWNWEVALLGTQDISNSSSNVNFTDPARVAAALASTNPATALNPFQNGPGGSPELLASLLAAPIFDPSEAGAQQASAVLSGPVFRLPAGPVEIVIGGELRKENIDFNAAVAGTTTTLAANRDTEAVFAELRVPLIGPDMNVPLVKRLTVTGAARYDHYSDFGSTFNPQIALEWEVDRALMLRASYGTSFRAPPLFDLYQPVIVVPSQAITDPRRNNEQYTTPSQRAGNPGLDAETADSYSAGLVYRPAWLDGARFGVDYWRIKQDRRVQEFTAAVVLANEAALPGRVARAAPTAQDIAAGLPGRVTFVNATSLNFGSVDTDGIDLTMAYRMVTEAGTFSANLAATYVLNFDAATLPNVPAIERAGRAHTEGTIPEWRATAGLGWSYRGLQVSTTARYRDSYADATTQNVLTGRRIDSQILIDAQVAFEFGRGIGPSTRLDGMELRVGVNNLFDTAPQFSEVFFLGVDPSQADLRQRFIYFRLTKPF